MVQIHSTGNVVLHDDIFGSGNVPPVLVGDPPQWDDTSDSSYAELETFESINASFSDSATARLVNRQVTTNAVDARVIARVRYESLNVDMTPPTAGVNAINRGTVISGAVGGAGAMTPTWINIPLTGSMDTFLTLMNAGTEMDILIAAPVLTGQYETRRPRTRIYEVHLFVTAGTVAPPCRIYPADTVGSVGGAVRQFPPSKSRQRSSRGVGYY